LHRGYDRAVSRALENTRELRADGTRGPPDCDAVRRALHDIRCALLTGVVPWAPSTN
jgi:hypothetical protein